MMKPPVDQPHEDSDTPAEIVAVCISPGGIPKKPVDSAEVAVDGLAGDGHDHAKHVTPNRAVSIQDLELLEEIEAEGYPVGPGVMGENLTIRGLHVQQLAVGDRLRFEDGPALELTELRKPCFVLDKIHAALEEAVVGRCGYLARVVQTGCFRPGQRVTIEKRGGKPGV